MTVDWLNYHHLLYFWTVAREGSIARAAEELRLSPPTVHAQNRTLEKSLGQELQVRRGRRLALTDAGRSCWATPTRSSRWGASW
jgi:LysR family transcriptional activator of nhaA